MVEVALCNDRTTQVLHCQTVCVLFHHFNFFWTWIWVINYLLNMYYLSLHRYIYKHIFCDYYSSNNFFLTNTYNGVLLVNQTVNWCF